MHKYLDGIISTRSPFRNPHDINDDDDNDDDENNNNNSNNGNIIIITIIIFIFSLNVFSPRHITTICGPVQRQALQSCRLCTDVPLLKLRLNSRRCEQTERFLRNEDDCRALTRQ